MKDLFGEDICQKIISGAEFSADRKYRYALWRIWDESKPLVMFIGLNPSTANETATDPTITRVNNFAKDWGYGGFYMMNLFGIVSSKPEVLVTDPDPLGDNDKWLDLIAPKCDKIVFAWGVFKQARSRAEDIKKKFPGANCLKKTKDGHPWHPLYVAANTKPILYVLPVLLSLMLISCYPAREANGAEHPRSHVIERILSKKNNNRYLDCPKVKL